MKTQVKVLEVMRAHAQACVDPEYSKQCFTGSRIILCFLLYAIHSQGQALRRNLWVRTGEQSFHGGPGRNTGWPSVHTLLTVREGRRKETQQKWECYSSEGKASWQSGAKECHKVTPHSKPHTRDSSREKNPRGWLPLLWVRSSRELNRRQNSR